MPKILAVLTLGVLALPAVILSLWWIALLSRLLHYVPTGDPWETQLSGQRLLRLLAIFLMVVGCLAIFWGWARLVESQLDTFGLRPLTTWAFTTLTSP